MAGFELRAARPDERFKVVALARDFHRVSGIPFEFCPAHASRIAQDYIECPRKLCLVLDAGADGLRGVLMASALQSQIAPVKVAQELVFWVDPDHRGRAPMKMIAAYEAWARQEGCAAAGLAGLNDALVARFYRAAGFGLAENSFLKVL